MTTLCFFIVGDVELTNTLNHYLNKNKIIKSTWQAMETENVKEIEKKNVAPLY